MHDWKFAIFYVFMCFVTMIPALFLAMMMFWARLVLLDWVFVA